MCGAAQEILITAGGENVAPVLIEDNIKAELPIVSHAMVVGDRRKFLSILLTLRVKEMFFLSRKKGFLLKIILNFVGNRRNWIRIRKSLYPF